MNKILLVTGEEILINLLQKKLTKEGYELTAARSGEEGLEAIQKMEPDLILADIELPQMNGFKFIKKARENPQAEHIPVIIISSSGRPEELGQAEKLGVEGWIIKAKFDLGEVMDKITKQLGG